MFGENHPVTFIVPAGGDVASMQLAQVLHRVVTAWRRADCRPSGAAIADRFGFSRQTWSYVVRGERWPASTVLSGLIAALLDPGDFPGRAGR